ncbi:hypothetical protein JW921_07690 [Candidatus Fermentibacterales bacterium]|nr:hypothetical protein [Candidatus Fermentibacterales bacterium]
MRALFVLVLCGAVCVAASFELAITEDELQESIEEAIVDPNVTSIEIDIQTGRILFEGTRKRPMTGIEDLVTMEICLDVEDGHLAVEIEGALINGLEIDESRLEVWNARIERGLDLLTGSQQGRLESVAVGSGRITLVWE